MIDSEYLNQLTFCYLFFLMTVLGLTDFNIKLSAILPFHQLCKAKSQTENRAIFSLTFVPPRGIIKAYYLTDYQYI